MIFKDCKNFLETFIKRLLLSQSLKVSDFLASMKTFCDLRKNVYF
jgi:hypothetical protein